MTRGEAALLALVLASAFGAADAAGEGASGPAKSGAAEPSAAAPRAAAGGETPDEAERAYADAFLTWIYAAPEPGARELGYLRGGQSVRLRSTESTPRGAPSGRRGCGGGWYAVEPAGFVCVGRGASLEPTHYSTSMRALLPKVGAYPFEYALSMGSPSYRRLPTEAEWTRRERKFGEAKPRPLAPHHRGHEQLLGGSLGAAGSPLGFLADGGSVSREQENRLERREVPFGSMISLTGRFEHEGRVYLQNADGTVVPEERVRLYRHSEFRGIWDTDGVSLPSAWTKRSARLYRIEGDGCALPAASDGADVTLERAPSCLVESERELAARERVLLTGRRVKVTGTLFWETKEGELLADEIAYVAERLARGAPPERWIHFSVEEGTLVAYERERPILATLASPGIGGSPRDGGDPLTDRTTPLGTRRITFKHRTDDMSPEHGEHRSYYIADVPFAMYFEPPFAIHVAYWHESFGEPMSGGCINVSPIDGERLFSWTTPHVPEDWYGVAASNEFGLGTVIVVTR